LVALAFLIGLTRPEDVEANVAMDIARPPKVLYELVANPARQKDWYGEGCQVEVISQNPLRYRVSMDGVSSEMETTLALPGERVVTKSLSHDMGISGLWDTRFIATPTGTRVEHTTKMKFSNPFLRFVTLILDVNEEERKTLLALKRYAEAH
jgi:hypothetical protein